MNKNKKQNLFDEAKERGCPKEMFEVLMWAGYPDENFLNRKRKARKDFPDIAKRWDATFQDGIDPNFRAEKAAEPEQMLINCGMIFLFCLMLLNFYLGS